MFWFLLFDGFLMLLKHHAVLQCVKFQFLTSAAEKFLKNDIDFIPWLHSLCTNTTLLSSLKSSDIKL